MEPEIEAEEDFDVEALWNEDEENTEIDAEPKEEVEEVEEVEEPKEEEVVEEEVKEVEEPKAEELTARERVKAKLEKSQRIEEERTAELDKYNFDDSDFEESMAFSFPDREIEVDGEKISLKNAAKDNPEIAALIKYAVGVKSKQSSFDIARLDKIESNKVFWKAVEKTHTGARDFGSNDKFIAWLKSQDDDIKSLVNSNDPEDVITALDVWKSTQPKESEALKKKKDLIKKSTVSKKKAKVSVVDDDENGMITPELKKEIWGE